MAISFFSSNSKLSGGALFLSVSSKEASVFFKFFKQKANDLKNRKENFDFKNPQHMKLNVDEVGGLARAVRTDGEFDAFHSFEDSSTSLKFKHYVIEPKGNDKGRRGFGFHFKRGSLEIKVNFSEGAAENLAEWLKWALCRIYDADYAADKKEREEYQAKKGSTQGKPKAESLPDDEKDDGPGDAGGPVDDEWKDF